MILISVSEKVQSIYIFLNPGKLALYDLEDNPGILYLTIYWPWQKERVF